jgi:putative hemolysin
MKALRTVFVGLIAAVLLLVGGDVTGSDQAALAIPNPASVYCGMLGYDSEIVDTPEGGQRGICIFPDGSSCDEWRFFECKCGAEWSYCAIHGYDWTAITGGGMYSPDYCACVLDGEETCPVSELIGFWWHENSDGDDWGDACDNCPTTATPWYVPLGDDDCDGFTTAVEDYMTTDPLDACPDDDTHDAWPLDIDMNCDVSVTGDVYYYRGRIGATLGDPAWWQRLDLDMNGEISVTGDVFIYRGMIGKSCTNP